MNSKKNLNYFIALLVMFIISASLVGIAMIYSWNSMIPIQRVIYASVYIMAVSSVSGIVVLVWKNKIFQKK